MPTRGRKREDFTGQRFGRWTVIEYSLTDDHRDSYWLCRCDCGTIKTARGSHLKNGTSVSCGCFAKEVNSQRNYKHGYSYLPVKGAYYAMLSRCYNPKNRQYKNYGGRGIYVCDRWRDGIVQFIEDMGDPPPDATIERIDNDGPYSPENCRWATFDEQQNNKRTNHLLEYNGKKQSITQWAHELGMSPQTIHSRIRYGWTIDRIFTEKIDTRCHHKSK